MKITYKILIAFCVVMFVLILQGTMETTNYHNCRDIKYFDSHSKCDDWFKKYQRMSFNSHDEFIGYDIKIVGRITGK